MEPTKKVKRTAPKQCTTERNATTKKNTKKEKPSSSTWGPMNTGGTGD